MNVFVFIKISYVVIFKDYIKQVEILLFPFFHEFLDDIIVVVDAFKLLSFIKLNENFPFIFEFVISSFKDF